ncbi:hypothetical protein OPT61_g7221 [Boeremia exigua]|uniref:Uncharacterized protein n=1 Tax=Boeremia exigua TaxID=749465 RepID=A0ACC2I327_9PLEO|nr:hypothetical protein OPT61_g7221 [Boeremia exigua]
MSEFSVLTKPFPSSSQHHHFAHSEKCIEISVLEIIALLLRTNRVLLRPKCTFAEATSPLEAYTAPGNHQHTYSQTVLQPIFNNPTPHLSTTPKPTMLDIASRRKACEDTLKRTPAIAASKTTESSNPLHSTFIPSQLPPLDKSSPSYPSLTLQPITIHNSDAFALARTLPGPSRTGVLNLASDEEPGGGWRYTLCKTQEEALCYSSTLYPTLNPDWFPFPNTGPGSCAGILSPHVVVFKDTLDRDLVDLPPAQQHQVAVISVAAPCWPKLSPDGQEFAEPERLEELREKVRLVLRIAAGEGVTRLVLGAMGCGAYGCPPRVVAREMKGVIGEQEFGGWFETIVFAVYAAERTGMENLKVFEEVFGEGM